MLHLQQEPVAARIGADTRWPPEVEMILSAMETARHACADRRSQGRTRYRVRAHLRLFSDEPMSAPWTLYVREINSRGLGFICSHRLPLGYGGRVELPLKNRVLTSINCTLLRCRETAPGWYEGALYFNREQPRFLPSEMDSDAT